MNTIKNSTTLCLLLLLISKLATAQYKNIDLKDIYNQSNNSKKYFSLDRQYSIWTDKPKRSMTIYPIELSFDANEQIKSAQLSYYKKRHIKEIPFSYMVVSNDNATIIGEKDDEFYVMDLISEKLIQQFNLGDVGSFRITPDGSVMALVSREEKKVLLIDVHSQKVIHTIEEYPENLEFSPDGRYLGLKDISWIYVYDLWSGEKVLDYRCDVRKTKKRKMGGSIRGFHITVGGVLVVPFVEKGYVGKKWTEIFHYAVVDIATGAQLTKITTGNESDWHQYSLDPAARVLYAQGKFFDVKSGEELVKKVIQKKGKVPAWEINWKFHPYYPGVYYSTRKGPMGIYSLK